MAVLKSPVRSFTVIVRPRSFRSFNALNSDSASPRMYAATSSMVMSVRNVFSLEYDFRF